MPGAVADYGFGFAASPSEHQQEQERREVLPRDQLQAGGARRLDHRLRIDALIRGRARVRRRPA